MDLSVVICTQSRRDGLALTLESVLTSIAQAGGHCEVVIVDNGSTDGTAAMVDAMAQRVPQLRRVEEPVKRLSAARNRGLDSALGQAVLFLDDDVTIPPGLIGNYLRALEDFPAAGFFGGPVIPLFENGPTPLSEALLAAHPGVFSALDYLPVVADLPASRGPFGANMLFRRSAIGSHRFDPTISLVSGPGSSLGDESDFIYRLEMSGASGKWIPSATVQHRIPLHRVSWEALRRFAGALGRGEMRLMQKHHGQIPTRRLMLWHFRRMLRLEFSAAITAWRLSLPRQARLRFTAWEARAQYLEVHRQWQVLRSSRPVSVRG